jgi:predicted RNA binding protein YcfA (HicA-like mRNA interferase family)
MASPSPHVEPYSAKKLDQWIRDQGAVFDRQAGSHRCFRLPNGKELFCPDPGSGHAVASLLARRVAEVCGITLAQLRVQMGYTSAPSTGASRSSGPKRQPVAATYKEMLDRLVKAAGVITTTGILPAQRDHLALNLPSLLTQLERIASTR